MTATVEDILAAFDRMTVVELAEFSHAFQQRYNVTATPPLIQALAPTVGNTPMVEAPPEPTEFTVVLAGLAPVANKINVIRAVRELTSLGLVEARDAVNDAPTTIREGVDRTEAAAVRARLEEAGAIVEVSGR